MNRRVLHLYGFNFTRLDIGNSRSFGVTTKNHCHRRLAGEADASCVRRRLGQTDPGKRTAKAADKAPEDQATADSLI